MPKPSFDNAAGLVDPFMIYNFNLVIPRVPGSSGDLRQLSYKIQTTSLPGSQIEPVTVPYRGTELNWAGRRIYTKSLDATVLELRDMSTRNVFLDWMQATRNNDDNTGSFASTYKVDSRLELYDDTNNITKVVILRGLWPTNVGDMQLDGSQSAVGTLQVTFSYDRTTDAN